jgi:hypothetical protein
VISKKDEMLFVMGRRSGERGGANGGERAELIDECLRMDFETRVGFQKVDRGLRYVLLAVQRWTLARVQTQKKKKMPLAVASSVVVCAPA